MWVKICANTNAEDALEAARLGADAVGFVFAPSTRRVTPSQVRLISAALPESVERVGVFGAGTIEEIAAAAEEANLTAVQMHGGIDLDFAQELGACLGHEIAIIQTLHWSVDAPDSAEFVTKQMEAVASNPHEYRVLIDAKVGASPSGGTGKTFDWHSAQAVFASQPTLRIIVAGGLRPENVGEAVRTLNPWGVDVASGVESAPGKKDFAKLRLFIENARGVVV